MSGLLLFFRLSLLGFGFRLPFVVFFCYFWCFDLLGFLGLGFGFEFGVCDFGVSIGLPVLRLILIWVYLPLGDIGLPFCV